MRGNFSKQFLKRLTDGDLRPIISKIIEDRKEFDIQVRDNYLNVYYQGGNILRIKPKSFEFDKFYFYPGHSKDFPKTYIEKVVNGKQNEINPRTARPIPTLIQAQQIMSELNEKQKNLIKLLPASPNKYFEEAKNVMKTWFENNPHQERKDQQSITQVNLGLQTDSDLVIIDIEFAVSVNKPYNKAKNQDGNNKVCRFDMIAVDSNGQLYVIELKQNGVSDNEDNAANVRVHKEDFDNTIGKDVDCLFAKEMAQVVKIKKGLGMLTANVNVDTTLNPIFAVAYSGENPESFNEKYRKEGICVIEVMKDKKLRK